VTSLGDCCDDYRRAEVHCTGDVGVQTLRSSSVSGSCGRALECGVHAVATGVDFRISHSPDDIVRMQLTPDIDTRSICCTLQMKKALLLGFFLAAGCTQGEIALRDMGSFHVGGREVEVSGKPVKDVVFTPGGVPATIDVNGKYLVESMYVQYFLPAKRRGAVPSLRQLHSAERAALDEHGFAYRCGLHCAGGQSLPLRGSLPFAGRAVRLQGRAGAARETQGADRSRTGRRWRHATGR
jgi:hypothetical protein